MKYDILNLPGLKVKDDTQYELEHEIQIQATVTANTSLCRKCNSQNIRGYGTRSQYIGDIPIRSKPVSIEVLTRRYECKDCGTTFYEQLPNVDSTRRMTERFVDWIGKSAAKNTFLSVAEEAGLTEGTIRSVFSNYFKEIEKNISFEVPEYIGIDEIKLKRTHCVITNIKNKTVVDVLNDRNKSTLIKYLNNIALTKPVRAVAIDMWPPYRQAVQEVFPKADIIIDKYHVLSMANKGLNDFKNNYIESNSMRTLSGLPDGTFTLLKRRHELTDKQREKLHKWFLGHPELEYAYQMKERFYDIYKASTVNKAKNLFANWFADLTPALKEANSNLIKGWQNWEPFICNYFKHKETNAYTESLNSLIRHFDRNGRGYSFDVLRAKILLMYSAYKIEKPPRPQKRNKGSSSWSVGYAGLFDDFDYVFENDGASDDLVNYGVDIDLLIQLLESGELRI